MRIDHTGGSTPIAGGTRARRQAKTGFAVPAEPQDEGHEEIASSPADAPAAAAAIGMLTAADSSAPFPAGDDAAASRQGGAVLQAMAGLQLALLEGAGPAARESLKTLVRTLPSATDPALESVLQAIAQRAAVELARPE